MDAGGIRLFSIVHHRIIGRDAGRTSINKYPVTHFTLCPRPTLGTAPGRVSCGEFVHTRVTVCFQQVLDVSADLWIPNANERRANSRMSGAGGATVAELVGRRQTVRSSTACRAVALPQCHLTAGVRWAVDHHRVVAGHTRTMAERGSRRSFTAGGWTSGTAPIAPRERERRKQRETSSWRRAAPGLRGKHRAILSPE
jgi:hypothetical protein